MNLGISVRPKEALCECEGWTCSEKSRNSEPCFVNRALRELWVWSRQTGCWIELSGKMHSKVWILMVSDSNSPHPPGMLLFMLRREWGVLIGKREEAFICYFPYHLKFHVTMPQKTMHKSFFADVVWYSLALLQDLEVRIPGFRSWLCGIWHFLHFSKTAWLKFCILSY